MLEYIQTDYTDVFSNINSIIEHTGTFIGTTANESMGNMKDVITRAMGDTSTEIDKWIQTNSEKGFNIKTEMIKSGNEQSTSFSGKPSSSNSSSGKSSRTTTSKKTTVAKKTTSTTKSTLLETGISSAINGSKGLAKAGTATYGSGKANGVNMDTSIMPAKLSGLSSNANRDTALILSKVDDIINGLSDRSKKVTDAERKKHSELWAYIAEKYGKAIHNKQVV